MVLATSQIAFLLFLASEWWQEKGGWHAAEGPGRTRTRGHCIEDRASAHGMPGWANGRPSYIFTWAAFGLLSHRERVLSGCVIGHLFWKYHIFYLTLSHPFSSSIRTQTLRQKTPPPNRTEHAHFPQPLFRIPSHLKGESTNFTHFTQALGSTIAHVNNCIQPGGTPEEAARNQINCPHWCRWVALLIM